MRQSGETGSQSPRVVHVIAPARYGGAESVTATLATGWLQRGGGGVAALMASPDSGRFVARVRNAGVPVWEIRARARAYLTEVRRLRDLLRRQNADVVHTHVYRADAVGYLAARSTGLPVVATVHGFTGGDWKNRAYQRFDRWLLRRFDAIACVSPALVRQLLQLGAHPERVRWVPNVPGGSVPYSRHAARKVLGLRAQERAVGWVGRLSPEKAPDRFLAALELLDPSYVGVVIGDGPLRQDLAGHATRLGSRARLMGSVEDADRLLPAFDVVVLSSRTEGTPMVVLEAMRCAVPVVSFAVGGIPDVLQGLGWLVTPGDIEGLAGAIAEVLERPEETARRAAIGQARIRERFGMQQWLDAYDELYGLAAT